MTSNLLATPEVFLDTAYAIALSAPRDSFHQQALVLADALEAKSIKFITTQAILLEIGNALAAPYYRRKAGMLLESLETDDRVHVVALSTHLYSQALQLFQTHHDKAWGITDRISFVVMRERGITEALTTDQHFQQAGFRALLRDI